MPNKGTNLPANGFLEKGDYLQSPSGQYTFWAQVDGNLVVYDVWAGNKPIWSSGTPKTALRIAIMQGDGNFVAYGYNAPYWSSNTPGHGNCVLIMQDDGNLVVYQIQAPIWHTK